MTRRGDVAAYIVAGSAILAFVVLLVFALFRLVDAEAAMQENEADNMLWAISETQSAVLLLDAAIARQAGLPMATVEVERRYNVVRSRLTLLSEGPQLRYMRDLGYGAGLAVAERGIRALESDILGLAPGDTETATAIHRILEPLIADLGLAANEAMVGRWEATGARLDQQRAAIIEVAVLIMAIIVVGIALSATMLRAMAQRQRLLRSFIREQEIAEAYRSFAALASHQFRTPLAVIDSSMQRLTRSGSGLTRVEIETRAERVRAEVRGLNTLIGATLDAIRLDAGQVVAAPDNCNIDALVNQVKARQSAATPGRVVTMRIGDEVPPSIETDPLLVEQILTNLVSNAVKYSPETEPVAIRVTAENRQICFSVEDGGVGIPSDEHEKLFGWFFRASTAQGIPGTGVGLSIASQLTMLLGGELHVVSRIGIGSVFTLRLPGDWADAAGTRGAREPSASSAGTMARWVASRSIGSGRERP